MVLHKPHVHYNNIIHILQSYPGIDLSAGCPVASFGHRGSAKQTGQAQYCSRLYCKTGSTNKAKAKPILNAGG